MNLPLDSGTSGELFRRSISKSAIPFLKQNNPELVFISAGFDAHKRDPLGGMRLEEVSFSLLNAVY